jgi:hypothetical protein
MDTYLRSALYRYENRPNAHFAYLLKMEIERCDRASRFSLEDAQKVMAVAGKVDPEERDTYPGIRATVLRFFPLALEN